MNMVKLTEEQLDVHNYNYHYDYMCNKKCISFENTPRRVPTSFFFPMQNFMLNQPYSMYDFGWCNLEMDA